MNSDSERDGTEVRGKIGSAAAMLAKVNLALAKAGIGDDLLIQVRQAALLNSLLVVFMGDLNW